MFNICLINMLKLILKNTWLGEIIKMIIGCESDINPYK